MPTMTGVRLLAETLHGYDVTHFFFMAIIVPEAMPEMERLGITRIMTHGEKPLPTWRMSTVESDAASESVGRSQAQRAKQRP